MRTYERKAIEFRQLCMVVKTLLLREPTIDNLEWKERTYRTLAKMGFAMPEDLDMVDRAMRAVEQATRQTLGPRPVPAPPKAPSGPVYVPPPKEARNPRPEGWSLVMELMAKLTDSPVSEPESPAPQVEPEALLISEYDALHEFWREAGEPGANRLALLQAFAEIAIVRPATWDWSAVRAEKRNHQLHASQCFACGSGRFYDWHHVIQIQHGGSNYLRNRVALCAPCHAAVHPWLPDMPRIAGRGWSSLADCVPSAFAMLERGADWRMGKRR